MQKLTVAIVIENRKWESLPRLRDLIEKSVHAAERHMEFCPRGTLTLLLTDNRAIRRLNRDFRSIDKPTNVLSFPQFGPKELRKMRPGRQPLHLGDIALAYQYIVDETKKDHKILKNHVSHLVIHGVLHILGYDHDTEKNALKMEQTEKRIMGALGLPDPYEDDHPAPPRAAVKKTRIKNVKNKRRTSQRTTTR